MATSSQGVSGPSGRTGSQPVHAQLLTRTHSTPEPTLTKTSQEESIANQIRKLTVCLLVDSLDLAWVHNTPDGTSALSKGSWCYTRYGQ